MTTDIRTIRIRKRIRQRDLADAIGVSGHTIRKWERGLEFPETPHFERLAEVLSIDARELIIGQREHLSRVIPGEGYTTACSSDSQILHARQRAPSERLRLIDLFCGCGGLSYGFEWTGHYATVCGIDLLCDRVRSFYSNHPYATGVIGDIQEFGVEGIRRVSEEVDVVVGGPPCQGFSSIRPFRTLTEKDRRNTLVERFLFVVATLRPRWFLFENVVGMLTHGEGKMLASLVRGFEDAGYEVSWRIINAALFGVPQHRERLFIVGNREGKAFAWPEPTHQEEYRSMAGRRPEVVSPAPLFSGQLPDAVSVMDAIGDLPPVNAGCHAEEYATGPQNEYQRLMRPGSKGLTLHRATKHTPKMLTIIRHSGPNISSIPKHLVTSGFTSCYSRLYANKPSTTLTVNFVHPASNRCIHPHQDRALTIREGARLQSFPDRFEFQGTLAQIVKQIGNAAPPLLARAIAEAMYQSDRD